MGSVTSDDLANLNEPLTHRDLFRILRSASEKQGDTSSAIIRETLNILIHSVFEDARLSKQLREELRQEVDTMSTKELMTMRNMLMRLRSPEMPKVPSTRNPEAPPASEGDFDANSTGP